MHFKIAIIFILQLSTLISITAQNNIESTYRWEESDTTLRFLNNSYLIWQYNYNNRKGKPYFHPLNVKGINLTCESPSDHPWHLGLWFSWKFINGLNYWEYNNGYKSEGVTEIKEFKRRKHKDFSTSINLLIQYHPEGDKPIMDETRQIYISSPASDGSYYIDYEFSFNALANEVLLDRTPIIGEPDGQPWGGYAGMSIRYNQEFKGPAHILPESIEPGSEDAFMYMGFETEEGQKAGLAIFRNPDFTTNSTGWYITTSPNIPFYYYSPSALYKNSYLLKQNEELILKYRIWVLPGEVNENELTKKYEEYLKKEESTSGTRSTQNTV